MVVCCRHRRVISRGERDSPEAARASEVIIFVAVLAFASGAVVGVFSLRVNELVKRVVH